MKTVFNKTLLASAVLAFAGVANAATLVPGGLGAIAAAPAAAYTASAEGFADAEMITIGGAGNMTLTLTNEVTNVEQDVLVLTFTGANIITTGANKSVPVLPGYDFFDFQGTNTIRFRVKTGGVVANTAAALSGVNLNVASLAAGSSISVSSKILSLNPVIGEYDTATRKILDVKNQLSVTLDEALNNTISTAAGRKTFLGAANDTLKLTPVNNDSYQYDLPFSAGAKVTHVIEGNFGFLRDADKTAFGGDANGTLSSGEIDNYVAAVGVSDDQAADLDTFTYALSADNTKLTITQTVVTELDGQVTVTITPPAQGKTAAVAATATALTAGSFSATVSAVANDVAFAGVSGAAAGSWKLDGSVVKVPYLVLQDGRFGTVVTVSNSGSRTGEILLDIVDDAGVSIASGLNAGSSTPGSIVNVSGKIKEALVAKGKDLTQVNKFSVTVTTNVPAADVLIYSAYTDSQNGGERAIVNNDSAVQYKGAALQ